jgi:hypothetical protein
MGELHGDIISRPRRHHPPGLRDPGRADGEWAESHRDMGMDILAACRKATYAETGKDNTNEAGLTIDAIPGGRETDREVVISSTISRDAGERCDRCSSHLEWPLPAS